MSYDHVKILITDSNKDVLKKLQSVLIEQGYEVFAADSVDKLLILLKINCFDLILLDVTLPNINALRIIESVNSANNLTAIITSSNAATYDLAIETVRRGAFDMLIKPYDVKDLLSLIKDALNHSSQMIRDRSISEEVFLADNVYQFMIENSLDIQYLLDRDGNFIFINNVVTTLLGYNTSELIGKHYTTIVYERDLDKARFRLHDKRSNSPMSQRVEIRFKCKTNRADFLYFEIMSMTLPRNIKLVASQNKMDGATTFGIAHDVSLRKKVERIVHNKSSYDHLTSLPNNILFHDRLNLAIAHAKRNNTVFAVMYMDLDGFKTINDTYGHHVGDNVLRVMSNRMLNCLRESDTLARVGGDEFTLLLPEVSNNDEAGIIAKKLTASANKPFYINRREHVLSVSIGIAFYPEDGDSNESIIQASDRAMYHIKHGNKNGYQFHTKVH